MRFRVLLFKEIVEIMRDRRAIISMILVPLVAIPVILIAVSYFTASAMSRIEKAPHPVAIRPNFPIQGLDSLLVEEGLSPFPSDSPRSDVETGKADVGIWGERRDDGMILATLYHDASDESSEYSLAKVTAVLDSAREMNLRDNMEALGAPGWMWRPLSVREENVAPPQRMTGYILGTLLGYILVLLVFTGGMYPAMDLVAGERERHTIEILLSAPVSRSVIVSSKISAVALASLVTGLLNLASYGLCFVFAGTLSPELSELTKEMSPNSAGFLVLFLSVVPLAIFAASLEVALASYAKSYREAQTYLTPLSLIVIFPAMASMMPGAQLTSLGALVPIYNTAMAIKGALMGNLRVLPFIISLVANSVYAAGATFLASRAFGREGILKAD
ncbi:MAG: ABC transporter permease subunit [candidate division WOR-3 bacterium]